MCLHGNFTYTVYGPRSATRLNFYRKPHADSDAAKKYADNLTRRKLKDQYKFLGKRVFKESELNFG
jgi:hypothetical protein